METNVKKKKDYMPKLALRERPLERALKSYIIPVIVSKYQVIAIRCLWNLDEFNNIWPKRKEIDSMLSKVQSVCGFFSCVTAQPDRKTKTIKEVGFGYWIFFDWPEYGLEAYENLICKKFMEAGLSIESCKSTGGRGEDKLLNICFRFNYSVLPKFLINLLILHDVTALFRDNSTF